MVDATATVLVLVHCQRGFVEGIPGLGAVDGADDVVKRLFDLTERARESDSPVVYLEEVSEPESDGPILAELAPQPGDVVIETRGPDLFGDAHVQGTLEAVGACHLVVAGFQSEICVAAAVRGATERGYRVTLVADAHGTFDDADRPGRARAAAINAELADIAAVMPTATVDFAL